MKKFVITSGSALFTLIFLLQIFQSLSLQHKFHNKNSLKSKNQQDVVVQDPSQQQITYQTGNDLQIGQYIVINGRPAKIFDIQNSVDRHGQPKILVQATDIFNGKTFVDTFLGRSSVQVPIITKVHNVVMSLDLDGFVTMQDDQGNIRQDLKLPNETENDELVCQCIKNSLDQGQTVDVQVLQALSFQKITECTSQ